MKYKDAVTHLQNTGETKLFDIEFLYKREMLERIRLRSHGSKQVSESLALGILKEMNEWIVKVCKGLGWSDDACEKARQECHSTAMISISLAILRKEKQAAVIEDTEARKLLTTYAILGAAHREYEGKARKGERNNG